MYRPASQQTLKTEMYGWSGSFWDHEPLFLKIQTEETQNDLRNAYLFAGEPSPHISTKGEKRETLFYNLNSVEWIVEGPVGLELDPLKLKSDAAPPK